MGDSLVYCQSVNPPHSVTMSADGRFSISCNARYCLGRSRANTPALPYGRQVALGGFRCRSEQAGITCTVVASGKGFLIDRDRVKNVGR
jgi:hypothetical protein